MKANIHPQYQTITITCACGNAFQVGSTAKEDIRVEICSNCHPLYTGKVKLVDTARRIDKFESRRQKSAQMQKANLDRQKSKSSTKKESVEA